MIWLIAKCLANERGHYGGGEFREVLIVKLGQTKLVRPLHENK